MESLNFALWTMLVGLLGVVFILYYKVHFWERKKIPHVKPVLIFGNSIPIFFQTKFIGQFVIDLYNSFPDARYFGFMDIHTPTAIIRDPELIKEICVKNFDNFLDHQRFVDETMDPIFGKNVFSLKGERWREIRNTLSPAFTATKMKFMFELIEKCAENFVQYYLNNPEETNLIESKDAFTRYTNDVIATAAFGISVDSLKDRNNEFYQRGKDATSFGKGMRAFKFLLFRTCPRFMKFIGEPFLSRSTDRFFKSIVREAVKVREEKKIIRPDMIHLLMEARDKNNGVELTTDDIISQCFIFFLAGFDTTSTAMCFIAHELAMNPEIQEKLREEIDTFTENIEEKITYETLSKMKYLDMVISEALRKYPPAPSTDRLCIKKYTLPKPTENSEEYIAEPNSVILIPIQGLHHDPKYYPDPDKFDPERFSDKNKDKIHPYTYLPFGIGPRKCIADRFALMETKILFVYILQNFILDKCAKTKHPIEFENGFTIVAKGGLWFKFTKLVFNLTLSLTDAHKMESLNLALWTLIVGSLGVLYFLYYKVHFWERKKIPHVKPVLIFGNSAPIFFQTKPISQFVTELYNSFPDAKYFGIMDIHTPTAVIRDPELIKEICVKNFEYFIDHQRFVDETMDPIFGKNVFFLKGERWREIRNTLSPSFTATKMKFMFELIEKCAENFVQHYLKHPEETELIDSKDAFSRYSNDVIATAAFGISVDSLKDRENDFFLRGKDATSFGKGLRALKFLLFRICPRFMKLIGEPFLSRATDQFFKRIVRENVKVREEKNIVRPDMIHLLMEARDKDNGVELTTDDIISQSFIFFLAGFDTTSTAMCFVAHELAMNPEIQEKLREEIETFTENGEEKITYDTLTKMKYLDMVISEALRKYPPAPSTDRLCVKNFTLTKPTEDSEEYTAEVDSAIMIPIQGLHHDPKYFPDPEKFDPERFSDENKDKIHPYAYLPFGVGPRKCIANRFALMETKLLLVYILQNFILEKSSKTKHPIVMDKGFAVAAKGGWWIKFTKRNQ
ncbi:uncharacterized protein LOC127279250 [Leptopilina boulardi]|uniref:uncharacterized protein LOC127279250 n=1 Tax=Leptopilina boulardi TaxID=63433 RepID=UPI0021F65555|nr:uncharacterized protein LOC127279250 [Leptopilina boulardi]